MNVDELSSRHTEYNSAHGAVMVGMKRKDNPFVSLDDESLHGAGSLPKRLKTGKCLMFQIVFGISS